MIIVEFLTAMFFMFIALGWWLAKCFLVMGVLAAIAGAPTLIEEKVKEKEEKERQREEEEAKKKE